MCLNIDFLSFKAPQSKRVLNMNFTQSLRWHHEYVLETLGIRKKGLLSFGVNIFVVQCFAVSLECSSLLKDLGIFFFLFCPH